MKRRDQAQIIQDSRSEFAGKTVHNVHGFFHQPLCPGNVTVKSLGIDGGFLGQGRETHVDSREGLCDDIVQFAADFLALLLLRREYLAG